MPDFTQIERIKELIAKYYLDQFDENEQLEFQQWIASSAGNEHFLSGIRDDEQMLQKIAEWQQIRNNKETVRQRVHHTVPVRRRKITWRKMGIAIAASMLLIVGAIVFWVYKSITAKKPLPAVADVQIKQSDAKPGGFHAKLTLSDGSSIVLDTAMQGKLAEQGKTAVISSNGKLVYRPNGKTNEVLYNTLTTSKGEMYATVLADGSKIWLNSESSIQYPVAFNGDTREITTTGECYYEIAKDASKPFVVRVGDMKVQVLGTHFNINGYHDDTKIRTTLLEGSVKIIPAGNGAIAVLKPGQQAQVSDKGEVSVVNDADNDKETAWKNRMFIFKGDDVRTVMNQLSRWYDLEVVYKGTVPDLQFWGIINMDQPASGVLKALQAKDARFQIEGKKIIVSP